MNCGSFKLCYKHVITYGNVFINHCLFKSVLGKTFTSKESHWTTIKRTNRRLGRINVKTTVRGINLGFSHWSSMIDKGDRWCRGLNLQLLVASMAREITPVQSLGHLLPLF